VPGFQSIGIKWNQDLASDLVGYHIQRAKDAGFTVELVDVTTLAEPSRGNYITDTELEPDTMYYYRVKGVDSSGNESDAWSPTRSVSTTIAGQDDIAFNSIYSNHMVTGEAYVMTIQSGDWNGVDTGWKIDSQAGTATFYNMTFTITYSDISGPKPPVDADNTTGALGYSASSVGFWAEDPLARAAFNTTTLGGGWITTGTLNANRLAVDTAFVNKIFVESEFRLGANGHLIGGAKTIGNIGAPDGIFFGYHNGDYKFVAGSTTGQGIAWTGSALAVYGDVIATGNIKANNISLNGGDTGTTLASVTINYPTNATVMVIATGTAEQGGTDQATLELFVGGNSKGSATVREWAGTSKTWVGVVSGSTEFKATFSTANAGQCSVLVTGIMR
jgi:hypothetical protein